MKKVLLVLLAFAGIPCILGAQSVLPDTIFGNQGLLISAIRGLTLNPYGKNMVMEPDRKVLLVGGVDSSLFNSKLAIKRYDNNGQEDPTFHQSNYQYPYVDLVGISRQSDGKILITNDDFHKVNVIRFLSSGALDTTFGTQGRTALNNRTFYYTNVFAQSDGKVIVLGGKNDETKTDTRVARLNSNGVIDTLFGQNGEVLFDFSDSEGFLDGIQQPDGKLVFCGVGVRYNFGWFGTLVRLNQDGSLDSGFGSGGIILDTIISSNEHYALTLQPDGKILVTGYRSNPYRAFVKRFLPNGTPDPGFGTNGIRYLEKTLEGTGILIRPNGKILTLVQKFPDYRVMLVQLLPNGENDPEFGINGVFETPYPGLRARTFCLEGNALTISCTGFDFLDNNNLDQNVLLRYILDLNVGTLDPAVINHLEPIIYPNPIVSNFCIEYDVPAPQKIGIRLLGLDGRLLHTFQEEMSTTPGHYKNQFDLPVDLAGGMYILSIEAGQKQVRSILVMKR